MPPTAWQKKKPPSAGQLPTPKVAPSSTKRRNPVLPEMQKPLSTRLEKCLRNSRSCALTPPMEKPIPWIHSLCGLREIERSLKFYGEDEGQRRWATAGQQSAYRFFSIASVLCALSVSGMLPSTSLFIFHRTLSACPIES